MTRSLVVTTWFPDAAHPSRTPFCLAHVHALQDAGVDVEVIHVQLRASTAATEELYEGVPVTRRAMRLSRPGSLLSTVLLVRRRLASADVLHTMAFSSVLVAAVPWLLRRRPWVHTEHWNGVLNPRSVGWAWRCLAFLRHLLRFPHAVTGVTRQLAGEMARFARPGATTVVPCVVEPLDSLEPFPQGEPLCVIGVGLVNERKNPLVAVETMAWLAANGVEVHYRWVGEGPLRTRAQKHARDVGLDDRVVFPGSVPPPAVASLISAAHVFFVPTTQENFFTAAAEAITAGRMVVLPRSGGFIDYCTAENSVIVDSWEPESFGRAILTARARLDTCTPESIAATLGDRFSHASIGREFLSVYRTARP